METPPRHMTGWSNWLVACHDVHFRSVHDGLHAREGNVLVEILLEHCLD
uniref:Uncharacterized protein n=1 Tax=Setaria italica TaxID=4555 RepID=K4ANC0_SETIT